MEQRSKLFSQIRKVLDLAFPSTTKLQAFITVCDLLIAFSSATIKVHLKQLYYLPDEAFLDTLTAFFELEMETPGSCSVRWVSSSQIEENSPELAECKQIELVVGLAKLVYSTQVDIKVASSILLHFTKYFNTAHGTGLNMAKKSCRHSKKVDACISNMLTSLRKFAVDKYGRLLFETLRKV